MKFIYKQNYTVKVLFLGLLSVLMCLIANEFNYVLIPMPKEQVTEYHFNILTINSIFSGFALTNLGILLSMTDDQLIKKLEGTDILKKRNIVIGHSIIFGAISIFISTFWVFRVNFSFLRILFGENIYNFAKQFVFYIEIWSLIISIFYFLLSVVKMIQLVNLLHVPRKRYSQEQVHKLREQIYENK